MDAMSRSRGSVSLSWILLGLDETIFNNHEALKDDMTHKKSLRSPQMRCTGMEEQNRPILSTLLKLSWELKNEMASCPLYCLVVTPVSLGCSAVGRSRKPKSSKSIRMLGTKKKVSSICSHAWLARLRDATFSRASYCSSI